VILKTRYAGNRQMRSVFGPDTSRPQFGGSLGRWSWSGEAVTQESTVGLTAVGRAIRLVSGLIASLPIGVFEGTGGDKRPRDDSPVARLLRNPVAGMSDFDWRWDIASALEADENAYLLKAKDKRGVVRELHPVPCKYVMAYVDRDGRKVFEVETSEGTAKLDASSVLHVRGQTVGGGPFGVSRFNQHRDPLGSMLAAQKFEGSYFRNHARPDIALIFPEQVTQEQAREWRDFWTAQYGGAANAGQAIPLGGGADIKPIPLNMRDAQFIEAKGMNVEDVGRIMDVDPTLLGASIQGDDKTKALDLFLRVQFIWRLKRIERGLRADTDLFTVDDSLYPLFAISEMIFADALTRAQVNHYRIQDGTLLADEARAEWGLPPLPDGQGQIPQITPVGGAPNKQPAAAEPDDDDSGRGFTVPSLELRVEQDMEPLAREMGLAFSSMADALGKFTSMAGDLQRRAAAIEETRERRDTDRAKREDELARAQAEALRAVGQPNITVNVEPTPVTVENTVKVDAVPVQLTIDMPQTEKTVTFERDATGRLSGAVVTDG